MLVAAICINDIMNLSISVLQPLNPFVNNGYVPVLSNFKLSRIKRHFTVQFIFRRSRFFSILHIREHLVLLADHFFYEVSFF